MSTEELTGSQSVDYGRLADLVRRKLGRELLKRKIAELVARKIAEAETEAEKEDAQDAFVELNDSHVEAYRRELVKTFNAMYQEVLDNLAGVRKLYGKKARAKDKFDVDKWIFDRQKWQAELTQDNYYFCGEALADGGQSAIDGTVGGGISFDQTDPRAIEWLQGNAKNAAFAITNTQYEALRMTLMEGIADGDTIAQLRNRISEQLRIARERAELIARTETLKASNRGRLIGMSQSGVVEGKQWLATYDRRTCPMCAEMDGVTMGPLDKPFFEEGDSFTFQGTEETPAPRGGVTYRFDYEEVQHPPLHPDCRCTILAVFKEVPVSSGVPRIAIPQGYKPAKSIREAEEFALRELIRKGGKCNYGHTFDLEMANIINRELYLLVQQYGRKVGYLGNSSGWRTYLQTLFPGARFRGASISQHAWAQYASLPNHIGGWKKADALIFNTRYFGKGKTDELYRTIQNSFKTGFHKGSSVESIVHHEYAHLLDEHFGVNTSPVYFPKWSGPDGLKSSIGTQPGHSPYENRKFYVSGYANENDHELWAEAFANYREGLYKVGKDGRPAAEPFNAFLPGTPTAGMVREIEDKMAETLKQIMDLQEGGW